MTTTLTGDCNNITQAVGGQGEPDTAQAGLDHNSECALQQAVMVPLTFHMCLFLKYLYDISLSLIQS